MAGLSVELRNVTKVFGGHHEQVVAVNQVDLAIRSGEFFTLLGPSGCGKTTTLRLIGGFELPTSGEVFIEGKPMARVPPYRRPVNIVFQNYALFPHLSVAENIAFGLAVKGVPRRERERRVKQALELVRLPGVEERRPNQLSGGQQQRVALARALVNEPAVLLLDEPLGALDLKLRKQMQIELKHLQQQVGITFIYVTHDQEEALTMSDRIAVMYNGEVVQVGDPVTVYERPATRFVADFIGESNFLRAQVLRVCDGEARVAAGGGEVNAAALEGCAPGDVVTITVRPEKIVLTRPGLTNGHALSGVIREAVYVGTDTRFVVVLPSGETVVARVQNIADRGLGEFAVGDSVKLSWATSDARLLRDQV
ncbi:MAG: ABC transporter ATP-binding protein [Chloroflexi bacterium]|nr:ABC transporter ATP-binding protein [Chloroflexota bacterium]